jgi:hypothetical protein
MAQKEVFLNCSEIASFIGQNKWDYLTPFMRLWKKVDKENYILCENEAKNKGKKIIIDKVAELKETLGEDVIKQLTESTSENKIVSNNIKESHDLIEKMDIDIEKKTELKANVESLINTNFGTNNEDGALEIYEKKYKVILDKSQYYNKINCFDSNKYKWYIGGKVDGILDKQKIIEVKTRTRCFFKDVREYENTQMQMYMYMYNYDKTDLVEFLPQNKIKIKVTSVKKDEKCIKRILEKLKIFTINFENFIDSDLNDKYEFYNKTESQKKDYLSELYINKMYT